ncbi:hypothetical protein CGC20_36750 [Leishmania donovani]|uniref:Uncharacterized protein n=1 Tax=Leishmania donovani TaxID=5661 RepID=A0A504X1W1_LEIDO|nr:hypothetical protein CGC20_36750 [Leishmania donovani]
MAHLGGHTTKQTYVTTYTTDIDPRMLPDFVTRGAVPAEGWRGDETTGERQTSAKSGTITHLGILTTHGRLTMAARLLTITAIASNLPLPITTSTDAAKLRRQHRGGTREYVQPPQGCLYEVGNGSDSSGRIQEANFPAGNRVVPSKMQPALSGEGSQNWEFRQHTKNQVETEEARGRLPTLQDLGIASYFAKDSTGNGSAVPRRREAPYAPAPHNPSNGAAPLRQQPWVAAETRYEVEGGKRYC